MVTGKRGRAVLVGGPSTYADQAKKQHVGKPTAGQDETVTQLMLREFKDGIRKLEEQGRERHAEITKLKEHHNILARQQEKSSQLITTLKDDANQLGTKVDNISTKVNETAEEADETAKIVDEMESKTVEMVGGAIKAM